MVPVSLTPTLANTRQIQRQGVGQSHQGLGDGWGYWVLGFYLADEKVEETEGEVVLYCECNKC